MKLGVVLEGGGVLGARTDGIISRLLPAFDIEYVIGTSIGAKTGLCIIWAQGRTLDATGSLEGPHNRALVAEHFKVGTRAFWRNACEAAFYARAVDNLTTMLTPVWMTQPMEDSQLSAWHTSSFASDCSVHIMHPLANLFSVSLPGIERYLDDSRTAALTTNSVHVSDGIEVLTRTRDLDGSPQNGTFLMHVASGIVPPLCPAINGHVDGAFARNGPIRGAVPENSDTPLIRVALGKPDFRQRYQRHKFLSLRAQEAFDCISEPLPTDRPTHEFLSLHEPDRSQILFPRSDDVKRRYEAGQREAEAAVRDSLFKQPQRPAPATVSAPTLALAA